MTVVQTTVQAVPTVEKLIAVIDNYMLEILITSVVAFVFLFLVRSFKRSMLIEQGQTRFVLEHYDVTTEKLHKWLSLIVLFLFLPLLAYVKYVKEFS